MADWSYYDCARDLRLLDDELLAGIAPVASIGDLDEMPQDYWRPEFWSQASKTFGEVQFPPTLPEASPGNNQLNRYSKSNQSAKYLADTTTQLWEEPTELKTPNDIEAWMDVSIFDMQVDDSVPYLNYYKAPDTETLLSRDEEMRSQLSPANPQKDSPHPMSAKAAGGRRQISGPKREILLREFERNPYPDLKAIDRLIQETGLPKKKITVWFNNRRSRYLSKNETTTPHTTNDYTLVHSSQAPMHLTESNLDQMQQNLDPFTSQTPLAAYIDTPLPEDPAQLAAIQQQAELLPRIDSQSSTTSYRYQPYSRVNSTHSIGSSGGSCDSLQSFSRSNNRGARRGRRLYTEIQQDQVEFAPDLSKTPAFFCTFCGKELRDRYQWKRHEQTVHAPRSLWVCDMAPCVVDKGVAERTFMRRDQFVQHVGFVHGRKSEDVVESARRDAPDIPPGHPALKCGFCGKMCVGWNSRVNHVLKHFQDGMKLTSWWLGRLTLEDFVPRVWDVEKPVSLGNADLSLEIPVWSCREIQNLSEVFRADPYEPNSLRFCSYCGQGFSGTDWTECLRHVVSEHNWRNCRQEIFFSQRMFHGHLISAHAASANQSISAGLCRYACTVLEGYELVREAGVWDVKATFSEDSAG